MIDDFQTAPSEWGWRLDGDALVPVMTDEEIAPQSLMKVIRCKCKVYHKQSMFETGMRRNKIVPSLT